MHRNFSVRLISDDDVSLPPAGAHSRCPQLSVIPRVMLIGISLPLFSSSWYDLTSRADHSAYSSNSRGCFISGVRSIAVTDMAITNMRVSVRAGSLDEQTVVLYCSSCHFMFHKSSIKRYFTSKPAAKSKDKYEGLTT